MILLTLLFELGFSPLNMPQWVGGSDTALQSNFYARSGIELRWGPAFVKGTLDVPFSYQSTYQFTPLSLRPSVELGLEPWEGVSFGFRHWCVHPVIPYILDRSYVTINYEGAYEEIYAQVKLKMKLGE